MDNIDLTRTTDSETYVTLPTKIPLWLKLLNFINLAPVLAWPLVFFSTAFFFDAPESKLQAYIAFIVVNSYPLFLIGPLLLSFMFYRKGRKYLSIIIPMMVFLIIFTATTLIVRYLFI